MTEHPAISQITLSCIDLVLTEQWFREGIGLVPDGGALLDAGSPYPGDLLEGPGAQAICWWLKGDNAQARIALIQFSQPLPRLLPAEHRSSDPGYGRIGFEIAAFDETLLRLAALGSAPVGPIVGERGDRRACLRSPDGLHVELIEQAAPAGAGGYGVRLNHAALSTGDLDATARFFAGLIGTEPADVPLHDDRHDAIWGLPGAVVRRLSFLSGDMFLELEQYEGVAAAPKLDDWRLSDQGIVDLRFATDSAETRDIVLHRLGAPSSAAAVAFVTEPSGAFVGLAARPAVADAGTDESDAGMSRPSPYRQHVVQTVMIDAPFDRVWALLNEHDGMDQWIEADEFHVTRHGSPYSAGYGAERLLVTMGRRVGQQVTLIRDGMIGYRAISGTPFSYHNGVVYVAATPEGVKLDWTIRFQTHDPALGDQVFPQLSAGIGHMLNIVKTMAEGELVR